MRLGLFALCTVGMGCAPPAGPLRASHGALVAETDRAQTRVRADRLDVTFAAPTVRRAGGSPIAAETWWTDVEGGLEQGWTLDDPGGDGVIRLAVPVSGGEPSVDQTDQGLVLRVHGPDGDLVGTGLASWDANHRPLEVSAVAVADGFELAVDVEGAAWPVTVDPVWYAEEVLDLGWFSAPFNLSVLDYNLDGLDDVLGGQSSAATVWFGGDDFPQRSTLISTLCGGGRAIAGQLDDNPGPDILIDNCATSAAGAWGPVVLVDPGGRSPTSSFVLADVNGDGYDDALTNVASYGVVVWAGGPDGPSAKPSAVFPTQLVGSSVAVGEIDGDRGVDIAVLEAERGGRRGGIETFTGVPGGFPGGTSVVVTSADMGVSKLREPLLLSDVIPGHDREWVVRGEVGGRDSLIVFDATFSSGFLPSHVWRLSNLEFQTPVVADADGDGVDDVLLPTPNFHGNAVFVFAGGEVLARQHSAVIDFESKESWFSSPAVGDFDGDALPDILSVTSPDAPSSFWGATVWGRKLAVHFGREDGPMAPIDSSSTAPQLHRVARGTALDVRDVDGDGMDDLLTWYRAGAGLSGFVDLHLGTAAGISAIPDWTIDGLGFTPPDERSLVVCDLDADGDLDVLLPTDGDGVASARVDAWMFDAASGFSPGLVWTDPAWTGTLNVACGDVEPGGASEVVVGLPDLRWPGQVIGGRALLFHGDSLVAYGDAETSARGSYRFGASVVVADVDGDGALDVAVTGRDVFRDLSLWMGPSPNLALAPNFYWSAVGTLSPMYSGDRSPMTEIREVARGYGGFGLEAFTARGMTLLTLHAPSGTLVPGASWSASLESFAFGQPKGGGALWGVGAAAYSSMGRLTSGLPVGRELHGYSTWEAPEGVVADHADSLAMGDYNHDAYDDLLVASDGCEDPEGCVFLFVGSTAGLLTDPDADEDGDGATQIVDCDDAEPRVYVGAPEVPLDALDNDCDGFELCGVDADGDGFGAGAYLPARSLRCDGAGLTLEAPGSDCDDADAATHPGAYELTGVDANCDGRMTCYVDLDLDGYLALGEVDVRSCLSTGPAPVAEDCDDTDPALSPSGTEIPGDSVDEDCDGMEICFMDADVDGNADRAVVIGVEPDVCVAHGLFAAGPADLCFGDDSIGDPDLDGACSDVDTCPNLAGEDRDADGVCGGDRCLGDDAAGDANRDGVCDDVSFRLVLNPVAYDAAAVTGTVSRLPPRTTATVFLTWEGAGTSHCVAGVCLDIGLPPLRQTVQADATGAANFSFRVLLNAGQIWAVQATVSRQGRVYKSNADIVRGQFLP